MIGALKDRVDRYLGRGRHSIAVPVMDGPLHPNRLLEEAPALFVVDGLDNLVSVGADLWFSTGTTLMRLPAGASAPVTEAELESPISCLAASPEGALAIGLDGKGIVIRGGAHNGQRIETLGGKPLSCATAAAFTSAGTLVVTVGAEGRLAADWKRDLMAHGKSGSVWEIDLTNGGEKQLARGLAYPNGVCATPEGVLVSEAWAHRLVVLANGAKPRPVLEGLPGYPSRIIPRGDGYVLCIFAPRNQLVEFVLREPEFLKVMTTQVEPDHWIVPSLMWGQGFKEPMQGAALKTMGIIKPWAPTWSYGLVAELDGKFYPTRSYHSRADGERHGVTSVALQGGAIVAGSKGAGVAVVLTSEDKAGDA